MDASNKMQIAIVGGGISGLATAFYLHKGAIQQGIPLSITLLEADKRLGGTLVTVKEKGFLIEGGPDSFVTTKPWGMMLCKELGIEDRLIPTNPQNKKVYVLCNGLLEELPPGLLLAVPTRLVPFLTSRLISPAGKLRMAMDLVLPRRLGNGDESLGSFFGRRFGKEAVEKIAEPLMGGIYLSEADRLSLQSTFPQFFSMEQKHRSLILGLSRQKRATGTGSMFMTLKNGMADLVEALLSRLDGVNVRTGAPVECIRQEGNRFRLTLNGSSIEADQVVLTVPAPQAAKIVGVLSHELGQAINRIAYASSATISLGFTRDAIPKVLDGTGFVVPRKERRKIVACTWSSAKFDGRAPYGYVLLRCFVGGSWGIECNNITDEALVQVARDEMRSILGIKAEPVIKRVFRWQDTNPLYQVGHAKRLQEIEDSLAKFPGLYLVGAGYRGVGIPDCIYQASLAANKILKERSCQVR